MKKSQASRATASLALGFASSLLVAAMVAGLDATWPASGIPLSVVVWLFSFVSGASVTWFVWPMVSPDDTSRRAHPDLHSEVVCLECGGMLYEEWRLCPHCGARLAQDSVVTPEAAVTP